MILINNYVIPTWVSKISLREDPIARRVILLSTNRTRTHPITSRGMRKTFRFRYTAQLIFHFIF